MNTRVLSRRRGLVRSIVPCAAMFPTLVLLAAPSVAQADPLCYAWHVLGDAPPNGAVQDLLVLPDGDLIVGGRFSTVGEATTGPVARWDGTEWRSVGEGLTGYVNSLARTASGFVAIGGFRIGSSMIDHTVAMWDGQVWTALDGGYPQVLPPHGPGWNLSFTSTIATLPDGRLAVVGQEFGGTAPLIVSVWNGSEWARVGEAEGSTSFLPAAPSLEVLPDGDIVVGGKFTGINGVEARNMARWDGTAWSPMADGVNASVSCLFTSRSGELIAGGQQNMWMGGLGAWDGSDWDMHGDSFMISTSDIVQGIAQHPTGSVVMVGYTAWYGSVVLQNGPSWSRVLASPSIQSSRAVVAVMPNGDIVVGGSFSTTGGNPWPYLAMYRTCLCPADRDDGTGLGRRDNAVTIDDLLYYLARFEQGTWEADLDNDGDVALGQPDGGVTIDDLLYFLGRFEVGC